MNDWFALVVLILFGNFWLITTILLTRLSNSRFIYISGGFTLGSLFFIPMIMSFTSG